MPVYPLLDNVDDRVDWPAESRLDAIRKDFRAFRTSLGAHPAAVLKQEQWSYPLAVEKICAAASLAEAAADSDVFAFGMVLVKQSPGSAKGMVFVTLEDETGFVNLALTPQVYARYYRLVDQQPFLCVVGKLQRVNQSHSILVKRVFEHGDGAHLLRLPGRRDPAPGSAVAELLKPRAFR